MTASSQFGTERTWPACASSHPYISELHHTAVTVEVTLTEGSAHGTLM
jgi:hypothetical protein